MGRWHEWNRFDDGSFSSDVSASISGENESGGAQYIDTPGQREESVVLHCEWEWLWIMTPTLGKPMG